ncbi:19052_t:CDS:2 [Funneliformis geosporum]|nr:19052_t:CDS:2 [Funneliformis geosporum]
MPQELQIKTRITEIESKTDKNGNPNNLKPEIFTALTTTPYNFINRQVLITYQELPNQDQQGTFSKVKQIELL